jgi:hypothetical protein
LKKVKTGRIERGKSKLYKNGGVGAPRRKFARRP